MDMTFIIEQIILLNSLKSLKVEFGFDGTRQLSKLIFFSNADNYNNGRILGSTLKYLSLTNRFVPFDLNLKLLDCVCVHHTNIQHLTIRSMSYDDFLLIAPTIAQVKSISIGLIDSMPAVVSSSSNTSVTELCYCKRLSLKLVDTITFDQVKNILKYTLQLKQLTVFSRGTSLIRTGEEWQLLLQQQCTKLIKFELFSSLQSSYRQMYRRITPVQSTFKTAFWVERNTKSGFQGCPYVSFVVKFDVKVT